MIRRLNIKKYLEGLRDLLYLPGNSKEKKTRQKDLMKSRMVMHFPHSDPEKQKMIVFYYLVKFSRPQGWQTVRLVPPSDGDIYPRLKAYSPSPEGSRKYERHFEQHQTVCSLAFGNVPTKNGLLSAFEESLKETGRGIPGIEKKALERFEKLYASDLRKLFS